MSENPTNPTEGNPDCSSSGVPETLDERLSRYAQDRIMEQRRRLFEAREANLRSALKSILNTDSD